MNASPYTATYTPRERGLFEEIGATETILAKALGFPARTPGQPGYAPHRISYDIGENSVVTLAMAAAVSLDAARDGGPSTDANAIRNLADNWAENIEEWLRTGKDGEARSTDYAEGFADGWSHALKILRSLVETAAAATPGAAGEPC